MNWAGIVFYGFIGLVGLTFGLMGYRLVNNGLSAGSQEGRRSKFPKVLGIAFALFGMGIVVTALWKCGPLLINSSRPTAESEELTEEHAPVVLGEVVLKTWEPIVVFRPTSSTSISEPVAKEAEPVAVDVSARRPTPRAEARDVVPVRPSASAGGAAGLGPPRRPAFLPTAR